MFCLGGEVRTKEIGPLMTSVSHAAISLRTIINGLTFFSMMFQTSYDSVPINLKIKYFLKLLHAYVGFIQIYFEFGLYLFCSIQVVHGGKQIMFILNRDCP